MAVNWGLYGKMLGGAYGDLYDERSIAADDSVRSFMEGIEDDPAYRADSTINGVEVPIVARRTSTTECSIKATSGTDIHIGDVVSCLGEKWIVVDLYADKVGIVNGTMWLCNYAISFQNNSPEIITRQCVIDDGTYTKKSSDPDAFVMTNTYKIYMPIDQDTERIYVDKRISLGEVYSQSGDKILEVYKVIGMDLRSKNHGNGSHLMVLTMQRDVYNPESDNLTYNLCDEYKASEVNAQASAHHAGQCFINGKSTLRIGTSRGYTVSYKSGDGSQVDGIESVWDVIAPYGVSAFVENESCTLEAELDASLVGEYVTLRVTDKAGEYGVYEMKVQVIAVG